MGGGGVGVGGAGGVKVWGGPLWEVQAGAGSVYEGASGRAWGRGSAGEGINTRGRGAHRVENI